jgi:hypothetical protein
MQTVVIRLSGGLGNQMCEYALGRAIALDKACELRLDLINYAAINRLALRFERGYHLTFFTGPSKARRWNMIFTYFFLIAWIINKFFSKQLFSYLCRAMNISVVQTDNLENLNAALVDTPVLGHNKQKTYYLAACYGHVTYFQKYETVIRRDFLLANLPTGQNKALYGHCSSSESSISIHIRRADYLSPSNSATVLGMAYYFRAVAEIKKHVVDPLWVVFSDDIDWCRKEFHFLRNVTFVEGNAGTPWEDLRLMSACKHHIIANSTFSWWGAFLGRDQNGLTYYPKPWFLGMETPNIGVKKEWIAIEALDMESKV